METARIRGYHRPTNRDIWQGRKSNRIYGDQYWHERIKLINPFDKDSKANLDEIDVAIIGYACDEGVKRNLGRPGAINGPISARQKLAKNAILSGCRIADLGDIFCHDDNMEECQHALAHLVSEALAKDVFPVVIGGGHDVAFAHFEGIRHFLNDENLKLGIVNLDAHFDLRPIIGKANSGTPFNQILTGHSESTSYLALGIQMQSNVKELFLLAQKFDVDFMLAEDCSMTNWSAICERLDSFCRELDYVYLTIDLDGFSSAFAPGVSAPSSLGFRPEFALKVVDQLIETGKLISMDIAELNPIYDLDSRTADLAARLISTTIDKL